MASWKAGRARMKRVLAVLPSKERKRLIDAVYEGAQEIVQAQRNLAPVRTGALKRSIIAVMGDVDPPKYAAFRSKKVPPDPELSAIITAGNSKVRYAHLVEFGTAPHANAGEFKGTMNPGAPAEPFFYPGFRAHKASVQRKINKVAKDAIRDGLKTA